MNSTVALQYLCNFILDDGTICGTMEAEEDGITCTACGNVLDNSKEAPQFGHSTLK